MIDIVCDQSWHGISGTGRYSIELSVRLKNSPEFHVREMVRANRAGALAPIEIDFLLRKFKGASIFWSPQYMPPLHAAQRTVITVHDLLQLKYSSKIKSAYFRYILRSLFGRVDKIVTVSNFSKAEIVDWTGRSPEDVVVVPNGLSSEFFFEGEKRALRAPYFLYVGNHRPHKNLDRLIKAFSIFRNRQKCILALTGNENDALRTLAKELGIVDDLVFIGTPNNVELAEFYRGAVGTVYISLYEGFGLPLIESMACGTPIIASNIGAVSETAGDDALLVNPFDVDEIAEAFRTIFEQNETYWDFVERGLKRSQTFSWDQSFRNLTSVLTELSK